MLESLISGLLLISFCATIETENVFYYNPNKILQREPSIFKIIGIFQTMKLLILSEWMDDLIKVSEDGNQIIRLWLKMWK